MASQEVRQDADVEPRTRWTGQLQERFCDAASELGGADKAPPKSVMNVPGLTLHHLKSHLQKHRLHANRRSDEGQQCGYVEEVGDSWKNRKPPQLNERTVELQIEVQRKLQEQLEVQKHLQLRIEAQARYLQSVLQRAQSIIGGGASSGISDAASTVESCITSSSTECKTRWTDQLRRAASEESTSIADAEEGRTMMKRRSCCSGGYEQSVTSGKRINIDLNR